MATQPIHPTRVCRKCGIEKPHTRDNFVPKLGKLTPLCRDCNSADCKQRYQANRELRQKKNRELWYANRDRYLQTKRRYYQENIEERKAADKVYREANREKRAAKHRQWLQENPDRVAAYGKTRREKFPDRENARQKRWRERNAEYVRKKRREAYHADPDKHREYVRRWYQKHRDRILADAREWRKANQDKVREWSHRRRSVTEAPGGFTAQDLGIIYGEQDGLCTYCFAELDASCEADHFIPIARGGTNRSENIVLACMPCNRSKGAKMPWEWKPDEFRAPPDH